MSGYSNDLPKSRREMLRMGYTLVNTKPCRECSTNIELWKTFKGRFIAFNVPARAGDTEEPTVVHGETCTHAKPAPAPPPASSARSRESAVQQLLRSTRARVVVAIYEDGAAVSFRPGLPAATLRHELITEANILQRALEANRG